MQNYISILYFWKHIVFLLPDGLAPVLVNIVGVEGGLWSKWLQCTYPLLSPSQTTQWG